MARWFSLSALWGQSVLAGARCTAGMRGLWLSNFGDGGNDFSGTRGPRCRSRFRAMWWLTTQKNGASALGLQRVLGLRKYETAWTWLHKLRRAMVRPGRDLLTGRVEVDEVYLGGQEEGLTGRQRGRRKPDCCSSSRRWQGDWEDPHGSNPGRLRQKFWRLPEGSYSTRHRHTHTDGWWGYSEGNRLLRLCMR